MQRHTVYFIWKLIDMFRVVPPPIIRSANNCIYSIWYLSDRYCYLPLKRQVAVTVSQIPDAVDTVVCAPDDGWRYHPKHVEQFPDKINCVTLHLVGYILDYSHNARTYARKKKIGYFLRYNYSTSIPAFIAGIIQTIIFRLLTSLVKCRLTKKSSNEPAVSLFRNEGISSRQT